MAFFDALSSSTSHQRELMFRSRIFSAVESGEITLHSYSYFLTQAYHHVRHTVPLLMQCGASLPGEFEWLRKAMVNYIDEEYGHDEWILKDLKALGADPETIKQSDPDENIELMIAYLYDSIQRKHPVTLLGMIYMLESTSTQVATGMAMKISKRLSLNDNAFSYLLSHGELDLKHLDFFRQLVNGIYNHDHQSFIIKSANTCYRLYTQMLNNIPCTNADRGGNHEAA